MISSVNSGYSSIFAQMGISQGTKEASASDLKQDAVASQTSSLTMDMSASGNANATQDAEATSYKLETQNAANTASANASLRDSDNSETANKVDTYA